MINDIGCLKELPPDLAYLAEPAMRYGVNRFDADIDRFLSNASDEQLAELEAVAEQVKSNNHYPAVNEWLNRYDIVEFEESGNLYFLFGVLDAAEMEFEPT